MYRKYTNLSQVQVAGYHCSINLHSKKFSHNFLNLHEDDLSKIQLNYIRNERAH